MPRPHVQIVSSANQLDQFRAHLRGQFPRLAALPGVVGIALGGGMARGFVDELSEIDLTLYLTPEAYAAWMAGGAPIPTGIAVLDGMLYDIRAVSLAEETARTWSMTDQWDYSYAQILHDPQGALARMKAEKLLPVDSDLASGPLFAAWWHYELAGKIWIRRGDALQGHLVLNNALAEVVRALFLANREYVPHDKWLVHLSRTLDWTPPHWETRLAQAMTAAPALASVQMRQAAIAGLWNDIDIHLAMAILPEYPLNMMHRPFYEQMMRLIEAGRMTTAEWQQTADLALLSQQPFHAVARVVDGVIVLDRERLLAIEPEEMYAWHYAVLDAARGGTL